MMNMKHAHHRSMLDSDRIQFDIKQQQIDILEDGDLDFRFMLSTKSWEC